MRADAEADGRRAVRIKQGVSGIICIQFSATAATAARGGALFRPAVTIGFLRLTLDPDNGKDQDCSRAFRCGAIHGWAQPSRSRIRWKFNDGAHAQTLSGCRAHAIAATTVIKNRTWLTAS